MQKRPLLGLTLSELQNVVKNLGMPGFSAKQIASWLYDKKVTSIDEMSNLSLKHRELLKEIYEVGAEAPVDAMRSVDGTVSTGQARGISWKLSIYPTKTGLRFVSPLRWAVR